MRVTILIAALLSIQSLPAIAQSTASAKLFAEWSSKSGNKQRLVEFEGELKRQRLHAIVPTHQILRTALFWESCKAQPFELPHKDKWPGMFKSLRAIRDHVIPEIGKVEIVSGYRNEQLNTCAKGSKNSAHKTFGAFDMFARGAIARPTLIQKLCAIHKAKGEKLQLGLGIYEGLKFHIDAGVIGYRKWGVNNRANSSPCL